MPRPVKTKTLQEYADSICDAVMRGEIMNAAYSLRSLPKDSAIASTAYVVDKVHGSSYYHSFLTVLATFAGS